MHPSEDCARMPRFATVVLGHRHTHTHTHTVLVTNSQQRVGNLATVRPKGSCPVRMHSNGAVLLLLCVLFVCVLFSSFASLSRLLPITPSIPLDKVCFRSTESKPRKLDGKWEGFVPIFMRRSHFRSVLGIGLGREANTCIRGENGKERERERDRVTSDH